MTEGGKKGKKQRNGDPCDGNNSKRCPTSTLHTNSRQDLICSHWKCENMRAGNGGGTVDGEETP